MVYDAFLFFNELDLLEIRLNLLNNLVDYFVISEATVTFSGKPKPLFFYENRARFKRFEHKIIHQVVQDTPNNYIHLPHLSIPKNKDEICLNKIYDFIESATNFPKDTLHYGRDFYQRDCLHRPLMNCLDEDIVVFSDIDEIPNPHTLKKVIETFPHTEIMTLLQHEHVYHLNTYRQSGWLGPRVANYGILKNISLNKIRAIIAKGKTLVETLDIEHGGWHFTNLGGAEKIIQKIESWTHQEYNTDDIKKNIVRNVEAGKDIFERPGMAPLQYLEVNERNFPLWLVQHQNDYPHLIRKPPPLPKPPSLPRRILNRAKRELRSIFN